MDRSLPGLIKFSNKNLSRSVPVLPLLLAGILSLSCNSTLAQTNDLELKQRDGMAERKTNSLAGKEAKIEFQILLEPKAPVVTYCQMAAVISYSQFGDRVQVESIIENRDCAKSSGEYTVRVKTRNSAGELQLMEHVESWARDDDAAIETEKFYDIGNDVDLIRVSTAKLTCVCEKVPVLAC